MANPKAYLIVAFYNRRKWHSLDPSKLTEAEEAAEDLFPERSNRITDLVTQGVLIAQAFASDLFTKVPDYQNQSREVRDLIVDGIYATQPLEVPVGWMAVVDEERFSSYLKRMRGNGKGRGLWPVFDIELIPLDEGWTDEDVFSMVPPLHNDQTTQQVYDFMTPTSWGH
jgi:hypothetical protein